LLLRKQPQKAYSLNPMAPRCTLLVVGDDVNEYDLSTAWDISTASYLQNFSVAAQEISPTGIFFKPDGTKMYVIGSTGDDVNEYDLSTAWDVSTASYLQNFSVAAQETTPTGIFFKPDGTKMYVIGNSGDDVNEYDLSTAWDVTTASYLQNFSVAAQENNPTGIFFKPDGTKMYVIGTAGDDVNEYDLSTAWDITTASYLQNFSVGTQETVPTRHLLQTRWHQDVCCWL
jgi:DNA-binding beta-propeller fold protein YncE